MNSFRSISLSLSLPLSLPLLSCSLGSLLLLLMLLLLLLCLELPRDAMIDQSGPHLLGCQPGYTVLVRHLLLEFPKFLGMLNHSSPSVVVFHSRNILFVWWLLLLQCDKLPCRFD